MDLINPNIDDQIIEQLWIAINQIHMRYLELDEGSAKIDQRAKLEECIEDFLCLVADDQKFILAETHQVFHHSVANKKDFSGYKAATGWNALQMYAGNLLSQPWRKEYHQIYLYCGFYKHQVEANLTGAKKMFEAIGYTHRGDGVLCLEEPICPDRLANVSRDCIIAYVECQMLKRIWEEITPIHNISWYDIYEYRRNHICDVDQCVRELKYLQNHKEIRNSLVKINNSPLNIIRSNTGYNQNLFNPPLPNMYYKTRPNPVCPNMPAINHINPISSSNGYYYDKNIYQNNKSYPSGVEVCTGQILDLDKDKNDAQSGSSAGKNTNLYADSHVNDWDYVYKNLEHQGYSKDLGERGDILNINKKQENIKESKHKPILNLKNESEHIENKRDQIEYKQPIYAEAPKEAQTKIIQRTVLQPQVAPKETKPKIIQQPVLQPQNAKTSQNPTEPEPGCSNNGKWECPACTYINTKVDSSICEMCSKTRFPSSSADQPIEIGGAECSHCTLVNPKSLKACSACSHSLENSPTYI